MIVFVFASMEAVGARHQSLHLVYFIVLSTPLPSQPAPRDSSDRAAPLAPREAPSRNIRICCAEMPQIRPLAPPQERIASTKSKHRSAAALRCRSLTQSKVQKRKPPHTCLLPPDALCRTRFTLKNNRPPSHQIDLPPSLLSRNFAIFAILSKGVTPSCNLKILSRYFIPLWH